ncbi:MAG: uridylate kinase [Bacteroidia bacterium]|nr:MAG: uridylate kinase [Bacteroidia bacterium]
MKYQRILLKFSGEALMGNKQFGIDSATLDMYAQEVKKVVELGVQVAIVIGGGNIFRGIQGTTQGMDRSQSDYMGMLATVINGLALQDALERAGLQTRVQSAIQINQVCEPFIRRRCIRHLEKGRIVILVAGTGNPYFTTDSAAALKAAEIDAQVVIKATKVDGVYTEDPTKNPNATKFDEVTFDYVINNKLSVMDITAFTLCQENKIPIVVCDVHQPDNLVKIVKGEKIGTLVS